MYARVVLLLASLLVVTTTAGLAGRVVQAVGRQPRAGLTQAEARLAAEARAVRAVRAQAVALAAKSTPDASVIALEAASLQALTPHILYVRLYGLEGETGMEAAAGCEVDVATLARTAGELAADGRRLSHLTGLWRNEGASLEVLARAGKGAGKGELQKAMKGLMAATGEIARLRDRASAGE